MDSELEVLVSESTARPAPTRRDILKWFAAGAVASTFPIAYASYASTWLSVEHHELRLPKWDADGFKVALISDLHTDSELESECAQVAIRLAIEQKPDLIAIPGDFVYKLKQRFDHVVSALAPLHDAKCPVVATLGNHDYNHRGESRVASVIHKSAARLLRNESIEVSGITIAGLDDGLARQSDPTFMGDLKASKSLLVLYHEPDFVRHVPRNVSLQLSGHSHGGQICLPNGKPIHLPVGSTQYFEGFYPDAKVPLFVTRGVGTVGPRLRLFCRPEVSILTLRSA